MCAWVVFIYTLGFLVSKSTFLLNVLAFAAKILMVKIILQWPKVQKSCSLPVPVDLRSASLRALCLPPLVSLIPGQELLMLREICNYLRMGNVHLSGTNSTLCLKRSQQGIFCWQNANHSCDWWPCRCRSSRSEGRGNDFFQKHFSLHQRYYKPSSLESQSTVKGWLVLKHETLWHRFEWRSKPLA